MIREKPLVKRNLWYQGLDGCPRASVFTEILVRGAVCLHMKHERNVRVLHDTDLVVNFTRGVFINRLQRVHDVAHCVVNSATRGGVPQFGRLHRDHVDDFRELASENLFMLVPQKVFF